MLFLLLNQQRLSTEGNSKHSSQAVTITNWPHPTFIHHGAHEGRCGAPLMQFSISHTPRLIDRLTELKFYVPPDTITGHFQDVPQANLLAWYGKTKPNATKERIHQSKEMHYNTK